MTGSWIGLLRCTRRVDLTLQVLLDRAAVELRAARDLFVGTVAAIQESAVVGQQGLCVHAAGIDIRHQLFQLT